MKLLNTLLWMVVASLSLWSCKKDEERTVIGNTTPSILSATATNIVLQESEAVNEALTLSWTPSDFGYNAAVNYAIQIGKKDSNFVNAKTINVSNNTTATYTVAGLNAIATEMKLTAFKQDTVEARVRAQISEFYPPVYSNVITLVITPYLTEPIYPTVYLVGDATEYGWDNTKATPAFRDETDPFVYTYTGYFKAGALKFLGFLGKWAPQWGTNNSGGVVFRETESDPDPSSFTITTAGYYTVNLDLRNNTYSLTSYDASGAATYNSIGIIGAFNGWSDIEPMTKWGTNSQVWDINYSFSSDTELKFRIAEGWSVNWGASSKDLAEKTYGEGKRDGENIKVKAGTYRILFNDLTGQYILIKS